MKKYIAAVHKAAEHTASVMTHQIRQHALNSGWSPEAANSLTVKYNDGKFSAHSSNGQAFVHEYGSEGRAPSAAVRKFSHHSDKIAGPVFSSLFNATLKKGKK